MCQLGTGDLQLTCAGCGDGFTPHKNAFRKQRFCSKPCADKASNKAATSRRTATCQVCGKTYNPKAANRLTCCSRECGWEYHRRNRFAAMNQEAAERRERERLRLLFDRLKQCVVCKAAFVAKVSSQVQCGSEECKRLHLSGIDIDKRCKACGEPVAIVRKNRSALCAKCRTAALTLQKRRAKRKYNARHKYATSRHQSVKVMAGINFLVRIAGTQCPCCGLLMSKAIDPNNDRALELDHALPLSRGGDDLFPNLRPICRKCNGLKGAFTAPDIVIGEWLKESTCQPTHQANVQYSPSLPCRFPKGVGEHDVATGCSVCQNDAT